MKNNDESIEFRRKQSILRLVGNAKTFSYRAVSIWVKSFVAQEVFVTEREQKLCWLSTQINLNRKSWKWKILFSVFVQTFCFCLTSASNKIFYCSPADAVRNLIITWYSIAQLTNFYHFLSFFSFSLRKIWKIEKNRKKTVKREPKL